MATIKDIARLTKLGYATISAYLNGVTVRPKNKEAIEKAIAELGYVRNEYARGLKTKRTMTIGVLIPELSNIFSTTIISEMEDYLRQKGYSIIVCDCRTDMETEAKSIQFLLSKMVDGIIIIPIATDGKILQTVIDKKIPLVVLDRLTQRVEASYVLINNRDIANQAVNLLIENNHKNIAIITGNSNIYTANERRLGYKDALLNIECYNENLIFDGKLSVEGGYLAMKEIAKSNLDVTAIFTTNYEMSVGAIIAINELGKKIPEDFSFVGFDNHELSRVFNPKLATVNQPLKDIGKISAMQMIKMIEGDMPEKIILNAHIERGNSIKLLSDN